MADAATAGWITPRLSGVLGTVASVVPDGYPAYARICHSAGAGGTAVTWSEVARHTGRMAHPTMQWHALVGSPDHANYEGSLWPGGDPDRGALDADQLAALCAVLAGHSRDPGQCYFGVWEGFGWIDRSRVTGQPRLHHPGRDYILLTGPLRSAGMVWAPLGPEGQHWAPTPNLMWPADRSWFVGSEIDFDSTVVGGPAELIQDLLEAPDLDAWPVGPDDPLTADSDLVNRRFGE